MEKVELTNIRKSRIGITALKDLKAKYNRNIGSHFSELKEKVQSSYNYQVELFIHDITLEEMQKNMVYNSGQTEIKIKLFRKKSEEKICGGVRAIICPLLDELDAKLKEIRENEVEAKSELEEWASETSKPVDFVDFDLGEVLV